MVVAIAAAAVSVGVSAYSASRQSSAAKDAAKGQQRAADQATALQREQWLQSRQDIAPWRLAGMRGLNVMQRMAERGPPRFQPFTGPNALNPANYAFQAPTEADMMQDPGYQFRMQQGQQALERSAAARGGLLSGGFARGLTEYAQGMGSQEYGNVYQRRYGENQLRYGRDLAQNQSQYERALQRYTTNYNAGLQSWQARMQPWQTLAYGGQQATQQLGTLGANYASNVGSILQASANAQGASQMAQANAWGNFANQTANTLGGALGYWGGGRGDNNPASTQWPAGTYPSGVNPWDPMWTPR